MIMVMPERNDGTQEAAKALTVRLPESLHTWLKREAFFSGQTMNALVVRELEECRAVSEEAGNGLAQPYAPGEIMPGAGWASGPCEPASPAG